MKKILVVVVALFAFCLSSKAAYIRISIDTGGDNYFYTFKVAEKDGSKSYAKTFDSSFVREVNNDVLNLAYLGNESDDEIYQATIQILIWKSIFPEFSYNLYVEGYYYNYNSKQEEILKKLEEIKNDNIIDYEISINDEFILEINNALNYESEYIKEYIDENHILLESFSYPGNYEINLTQKKNVTNSIYSDDVIKDLILKINVKANKGIIKWDDLDDLLLVFDVYNLDTNEYLKTLIIEKESNSFYYEKNINLRLEDVTNSEIYEKLEDIIIKENESDLYDINIKLLLKKDDEIEEDKKDEVITEEPNNKNEELEEEKKEEVIINEEIKVDDEVEIEIPNTGIEFPTWGLYVYKKRYYLYKCSNLDIMFKWM